jgi:signal transduction histidine kinase
LFFSLLSFAIIIILANKAIDYFSFVTIEKQMVQKADLSELSFREILAKYNEDSSEGQDDVISKSALERLKTTGKEVRIYDRNKKLLGLAEDGIIINGGKPQIFERNIEKALEGKYSYTVSDQHMLYFAIPIQDKYYQNAYVFEFVEDISYFYEIMAQIRNILFIGAGGFLVLITLSSLFIARNTTKPIKYLLGATKSFSKQQFHEVKLNRKDELGMLASGLNQMGIQLNNYIQYQKQFVSNVSHELKTPLAAIHGFSQYLYEGENADENLQKIYSHLVNESDRLNQLINELLMLAQFDKVGTDEMGSEKTDISKLINQVAVDRKPNAKTKGIELIVKPSESIYVYVNQLLLSHAIANILDNAIKYSNSNTKITMETFVSQHEAVIQISDQGIGIREDEIVHVQERFYRASNANSAKGSGLGLSICKEIAEKFNGHLKIESKVNEGTIVSILLPLYELQE